MVNIHAHKTDLKKITEMIKAILDVDAAIFDLDSQLLAATDEYINQKGHRVHAPSIQEVLTNGNVVVNKPGHMQACSGCRFLGNCPAKIEILKRFGPPSGPIGVITLTSFSGRGHDKITRETKTYINALTLFSEWISDLITDRDKGRAYSESEEVLNTLMDISADAVLTIDTRGMVTRGNTQALKLFAFCDLCTRSAFHILPESMVDKILSGNHIRAAKIRISSREAFLSARPVYTNDEFTGAVLTLARQAGTSPQKINSADPCRENTGLNNVLGKTPAMVRIKKTAARLSGSASTILITGGTGTGKGLLAKAIHHTGSRKDHPFVPVNCAGIPDTLFESELFGYEEGAFTGAKKGGKPGRFEMAHQGTLFLDEIGEMPLHLQAKLLNVLQDHSFQRVGGLTFIPVDVRVIAATNQDLESLVREKRFRADLFYRLNVIPMDLPPLSERKKDLPILCNAFVKDANHRAGTSVKGLSPGVMDLFYAHHWPGNVRELQNIIEYSVNMTQNEMIRRRDLPQRFLDILNNAPTAPEPQAGQPGSPGSNIKQKAIQVQARAIQDCLDRYGHDVNGKKKTARELGISLRTLYRKLESPA